MVGARRVVGAVLVVLAIALAVPATGAGAATTRPEGVAFWYQKLRAEDVPKLGRPQLVVLGTQGSQEGAEAAAVDRVHGLGAAVYRYSHFWTFPRPDHGIDLGAHPEWQFCGSDGAPLASGSAPILDLNERDVATAVGLWMAQLRSWGYDGIFLDQGATATSAPGFWQVSTCTADPVAPGRTMSDAYAALIGKARGFGLKVFMNMGRYSSVRPDPTDEACHARRFDTCRINDDVVENADYVLVENRPIFPPVDATVDPNLEDELAWFTPAIAAPRGGAAPVALGKIWAAPSQTTRIAFYLAAVGRIAGHPVAVGAGDDRCGEPPGSPNWFCGRGGIAPPRLVNTRLGRTLDASWTKAGCDADGTHCVLVRRYARGLVVLNPTNRTRDTGAVALGTDGCRVIQRRSSGLLIGDGKCLTSLRRIPGPFTGELYQYRP